MATKTILFLLMSLVIVGCNNKVENDSRVETLPFYNEATFTPHWIAPGEKSLETFHRISPFELINQEGNTITNETFKGKIHVVDFFFTSCPGICPKMASNMMLLQEEFLSDEDVLLMSHSVTPKSDSVSVLKAYAESKGIASHKWHLVTGEQSEIYKLGRKDYFVEEDLGIAKHVDDFLHTENFVLIDRDGHIRGIYNGLSKPAIHQLTADIKTLKAE